MKILLIDIEVAPNTAHVWGIFDQNISINQLLESSYTLCYAAKWYGESKIMFDSIQKSGKQKMLDSVHKLLDEADAIVHYNGSRFDIPILHKEFLLSGMPPPAPSKQIDLLQVARRQFRFVSNKLDYVAQALGLGSKTEHEGHALWVGWIKQHPNHNAYSADVCCPNCASRKLQSRGTQRSRTAIYQRYQCQNCGSWARSVKSEKIAKDSLVNI